MRRHCSNLQLADNLSLISLIPHFVLFTFIIIAAGESYNVRHFQFSFVFGIIRIVVIQWIRNLADVSWSFYCWSYCSHLTRYSARRGQQCKRQREQQLHHLQWPRRPFQLLQARLASPRQPIGADLWTRLEDFLLSMKLGPCKVTTIATCTMGRSMGNITFVRAAQFSMLLRSSVVWHRTGLNWSCWNSY